MQGSDHKKETLERIIENSWKKISPFWTLKNLVAVNPLSPFEDLPFEKALQEAETYFQQKDLPEAMQEVNRESIQWLQAFFDEGQATIQIPMRQRGLLKSILILLPFAHFLPEWIKKISQKPEKIIERCLAYLKIPANQSQQFLILMLTTLPGWSSHIQYRTGEKDSIQDDSLHPDIRKEYLALRILLTSLLWSEGKTLLNWYERARQKADSEKRYTEICRAEESYRNNLINTLKEQSGSKKPQRGKKIDAQMIFCIDVRSEPFRRSIEAQGNYETYSYSGSFGLPIAIENTITQESYPSCPALLKPLYKVMQLPLSSKYSDQHQKLQMIRKLHQSLNCTFGAPLVLVPLLGMVYGLWMGMRNFFPRIASRVKKKLQPMDSSDCPKTFSLKSIPIQQQAIFASNILRITGLTDHFAPIIIFCGHGSSSENNAYSSALNCGACSGRQSGPNAQIMAEILHKREVRQILRKEGISLPESTYFLGAEHNTTTDEVIIYDHSAPKEIKKKLSFLKESLFAAQRENSAWRCLHKGLSRTGEDTVSYTQSSAKDWSEVNPEGGLTNNASFIAGPRWLTKKINLQGRAFLHSYDWQRDHDHSSLEKILTAPMVVTQWINCQYLFSALDHTAFGGGERSTQNITGKMGIMQGNASDLMHGLPLQSLCKKDGQLSHEPIRLTAVIYAPKSYIRPIIDRYTLLQKLFGNGWVTLLCLDPQTDTFHLLQRDFTWSQRD